MVKKVYILLIIPLFFSACNHRLVLQKIPDPKPTPPPMVISKPVPPIDSTAIKLAMKIKYLQEKFPDLLARYPDSLTIKLYSFIDEWLNTPFKLGGTDKNGIDCSAFVQRLFHDVYSLKIPRTSKDQLNTNRVERFKPLKYLEEGDILFFVTDQNKGASHVGFYLGYDKFISTSADKGVSIFSLSADDSYWKRRYVIAGRVKVFAAKENLENVSMR